MRDYLKAGTYIEVPGQIRYRIVGSPIGEGGCSLIYTAKKYIPTAEGVYSESPLDYAIKECFPNSVDYNIYRNEEGSIVAGDDQSAGYLATVKRMQLNEADVSGRIFNVGFRTTPVLETYENVAILDEEGELHVTDNLISVLGSLSEKGQSIKSLIDSTENRKLTAEQTFRIAEQLLYAIDEVHKAGYLHLDIQDGNVFLHGSLESRNTMVSLLDFGTARKLSAESGSCEINSKEVYSTQGFTAPEILLSEGETISIGRAADIYSIGALMLYLLTGRRSSSKELISNAGKSYVPKFAIPSIKCPKHLVDKMQEIISKALAVETDKRYPNASEMLEAVTDFLEEIAPYRNPLTSNSYDAFICYKHNELDNTAAKTLRDSLERFKVRSSGSRGKQQIKSVFLDEGELSSCADFGERINDALKKSEWLIVICSPETKESKWVNEEIKTFLKYHDKSHILAVVTDGEPDDVYPQELKKNGLDASTLFAADARAGGDLAGTRKLIRKDVKLRIAAAILGTTYDALKQRRRQYELRLVAIYAVVVTVMLGFAVFKTIQVNTEHRKFLDSQSEYMKEQAFNAYRDNDIIGVLKNSIAAYDFNKELGKNDNAPVQLIQEVLHLYEAPGSDSSIEPFDTWTPDSDKDNAGLFVVLESGKYIATADYRSDIDEEYEYRIYIWDAETRKVVSSFDSDIFTEEMFADGHHCMVADWGNKTISYYDYISEKTEWNCDCEMAHSVEMSPDGKHLIVNSTASLWLLYDIENKTWILVAEEDDGDEAGMDDDTYIECQFTRKGDLLVTATTGVGSLWSFYGAQTGSKFNTKCIDLSDYSIKWEYSKDFRCLEWAAYAVAVDDYVGLVYGNNIDYLDVESGELLHHTEAPSHIQDIVLDKDYKSFKVLLTDGSICSMDDDGNYSWLNLFPNRTGYCYYGKGCMYTRTMENNSFGCKHEILIYRTVEGDENYIEIDEKDVPKDVISYDYMHDYDQDYADSIAEKMQLEGDAKEVGLTSDRRYAAFFYDDHLTVINTDNWQQYDGGYGDNTFLYSSADQLKYIDDNTLLALGFHATLLSLSDEGVEVIYEDERLDEYQNYDSFYEFDPEYIELIKDKVGLEGQEEKIAWTTDREYALFYFKDSMSLINTRTWKRIDGDYGGYGYSDVMSDHLEWIDESTIMGIESQFTFIKVSDASISIECRVYIGSNMKYSLQENAFFFTDEEKGKVYRIGRYTPDEIVQLARDRIGDDKQ